MELQAKQKAISCMKKFLKITESNDFKKRQEALQDSNSVDPLVLLKQQELALKTSRINGDGCTS